MAATPKRRRMRAALARRAVEQLGEGASPLDYVCYWLVSGGLIVTLAQSLREELGESVSRPITSMLVHSLATDAKERIAGARREGRTPRPRRREPSGRLTS